MMEIPEIVLYRQVKIPEDVEIWLDSEPSADGNVILESNALKQPKIIVYPEFRIEGEKEWIIFSENKILKFNEDLEGSILRELPKNVYPIIYNNNIDFIYEKRNKYIFRKNVFFKFDKKYNFFILIGKKISILGNREKFIEVETPKAYHISRNHISILYENESKIYNKSLENIKNFKNNFLYLGSTKLGEVFVSENGRVILKDEFIGICQGALLLGEIKNGFVLKCDNKVKIYKDGTFISIESNVYENSSIANNKYMLFSINNSTILYNYNLEKILEMKKVKAAYMMDNFLILITMNNNLYILNLEKKKNNLIRIINNKNTKDQPIIVEIKEDIPFNISISNNFIIVDKNNKNKNIILKIEPIEFKEDILKITLENDLIKHYVEFKVDSEKPKLNQVEAILRTARNGRVRGTQYNSELEVKIDIDLPSRLTHEIKIDLDGSQSFTAHIDGNYKILKMYLNNYEYNINYKILKMYLNRINKTILEIETPVKIIIVEKPNEFFTEQLIEDRRVKIRKMYFKDIFEWEEIEERIIDYDDVIIIREGDCVTIEGESEKICGKEGINKLIKKTKDGYKTFYIIAYPNPINDINCSILDNQLLKVNVNLKREAIVEIIYGNNIAFGKEALFKFDPFYNEILLKSYIGNLKWENVYRLDSLRLGLSIARQNYERLRDMLQTFGVL